MFFFQYLVVDFDHGYVIDYLGLDGDLSIYPSVGSIVGAVTGGLIGLATESGLLRGAGIGAISGAVFCIEAVESSIALRQTSNRSGIRSLVFVV